MHKAIAYKTKCNLLQYTFLPFDIFIYPILRYSSRSLSKHISTFHDTQPDILRSMHIIFLRHKSHLYKLLTTPTGKLFHIIQNY